MPCSAISNSPIIAAERHGLLMCETTCFASNYPVLISGQAEEAALRKLLIGLLMLTVQEREREREVFCILCPASSLMDVPGYANPDKLMNVPIGFVCR